MKHGMTHRPSDADLKGNPAIGASKGVTRAQVSPADVQDSEGKTTFEGDLSNDTNPSGGIDKAVKARHATDRE